MIQTIFLSALSPILFGIGLALILMKKNLILKLLGVEFVLNAGMINLIFFNQFYPQNLTGQTFTLIIMAIAASEIAIALAIIIQMNKQQSEKI
jgi:NADH-quinone oxidoreductase subunit K